MKSIYLFVFLSGILLPPISCRHVQFYRKDYTYFDEFDAFYKVHWDLSGASWNSAFLACDDEGATLFYPKAKGEWALVKNLTNKMTEVPNITDIFVGIHDEFGLGEFITVDGHSTPYPLLADEFRIPDLDNCITMNIETGLFKVDTCIRTPDTPLPFVCKKVDSESCPTVDQGYKYSRDMRKCYKVNKRIRMWQEAMQTCFMEGGVLAVIDNKVEADVVNDLVDRGQSYFVGVRRIFSHSDFYTVTGQKFSEMYQRPGYSEDSFDCGTVYSDGRLYIETKSCGERLPFICEMDTTL